MGKESEVEFAGRLVVFLIERSQVCELRHERVCVRACVRGFFCVIGDRKLGFS